MLHDVQKQMIADAYEQSKELVLQIFLAALEMGDDDTVRYIAEHYADEYGSEIASDMQDIVEVINAEAVTIQ